MTDCNRRAAALALAATLCSPWLSAPAAAQATAPATPPGKLPPSVQVAGKSLRLNGQGVRYRAMFRVYAIGAYATTHFKTLEQFLAAAGPKRLQLVTLRQLTGDSLGVAMVQGMQDNAAPGDRGRLVGYMGQLSRIFGEEPQVPAATVLAIDFVPGRGTVLRLNDVEKGVVGDPAFYPAAARIWLGDKPVDAALKDALLGIERPAMPEAGG